MTNKTTKRIMQLILMCCIGLVNQLNAQTGCDITNGLVHEWKFDNNLLNSVGASNGSLTNYFSVDRFGNPNGAVIFQSSTFNQISISPTYNIQPADNFTYSVWAYIPDFSAAGNRALAFSNSTNSGFVYFGNNPNTAATDGTYLLYNSVQGVVAHPTHSVKAKEWHHVAFVKLGDTTSVYVNGQFISKARVTNPYSIHSISYLFGLNSPNASPIGSFDDLRFYNRALNAGEIDSLVTKVYRPCFVSPIQSIVMCGATPFVNNKLTTNTLGAVGFQWYKGATLLNGATASSLTFYNGINDTGSYRCVITNACGLKDTSDIATVQYGFQNYPAGLVWQETFSSALNYVTLISPPTATDLNGSINHFGTTASAVNIKTKAGGLTLNSPFTNSSSSISLWYKYDQTGNSNITYLLGTIAIGASNTAGFSRLAINTFNEVGIVTTGISFSGSGYTLTDGVYYHFVVTNDGPNESIYINGQLIATYTNAQLLSNYPITYIGNTGQGALAPYRGAIGMIDNIQFYNTILSGSDIYNLYSHTMLEPITNLTACTDATNQSLTVNVLSSNPNSIFYYKWKKGATYLSNSSVYSGVNTKTLGFSTITAAEAGTYSCEVISECFAYNSSSATVTASPAISGNLTASALQPSCGATNGSISYSASNGEPTLQYFLNGVYQGVLSAASNLYANAVPGQYELRYYNTPQTCLSKVFVTVNPNTANDTIFTAPSFNTCGTGNTAVTAPSCANTSSTSNWIYLKDQHTGGVVAAINTNGQNLGTVTATMYNEINAASTIAANNDLPEFTAPYLNKMWTLSSTTAPTMPVNVRFYFLQDDLYSLKQAVNCISCSQSDLILSHISGTGIDCDASNNTTSNFNLYWSKNAANTANELVTISNAVVGTVNNAYGNNSNLASLGGSYSQGQDIGGLYFEAVVNQFSEFRLHMLNSNTPLPLVWKSFKASLNSKNQTELSWITSSEKNTARFELEKSIDAKNWTKFDEVASAGNSDYEQSYETMDNEVAFGITYYRIKQIDLDNKFTYSTTQKVIRLNNEEISIYPNPAMNTLNISVNKENSLIEVYTMSGQLLTSITNNEPMYKMNVQSLPKGMYMLRVSNNEKVYTAKFTKQ